MALGTGCTAVLNRPRILVRYKQSGIGRDKEKYLIQEFLDHRAIWFKPA